MENHKRRAEIEEALANGVGWNIHKSPTLLEDRMYVAVRLMHGDRPIAVVRTSLPLTALNDVLSQVQNRVVIATLIGVLCYAVISLVISRRMSRPLEEIKAGVARFAAGDLSHRCEWAVPWRLPRWPRP